MTGVRNSIRQQQSSWVYQAKCKACTFCFDAGSVCDQTVMCVSSETTEEFSPACLHAEVWRQKRGWGGVGLSWHNGLRPGNGFWEPLGQEQNSIAENSQQGAEVRSRGNEARSRMGLSGGEACDTVEECHFFAVLFSINRCIFTIPQVLKFIITKPLSPPSFLHPLSLRFPQSPADKTLSWYSSRPLAPCFIQNPVDRYLQVERLSNCLLLPDYQRWEKDMASRRWSGTWGRLWVTDMLSLTTDNRCFPPSLIWTSEDRS